MPATVMRRAPARPIAPNPAATLDNATTAIACSVAVRSCSTSSYIAGFSIAAPSTRFRNVVIRRYRRKLDTTRQGRLLLVFLYGPAGSWGTSGEIIEAEGNFRTV